MLILVQQATTAGTHEASSTGSPLISYAPIVSATLTALTVLVGAVGLWLAYRRYQRELPYKRLSYSIATDARATLITITIQNSGNADIKDTDFISESFGFDFGDKAALSDDAVSVCDQTPEDLGIENVVSVSDARRITISPIHLNTRDQFTLCILASPDLRRFITPYGRIRGAHRLFRPERDIKGRVDTTVEIGVGGAGLKVTFAEVPLRVFILLLALLMLMQLVIALLYLSLKS